MKNAILFGLFGLLMLGCKPKEISWVAIGDSITYLNDHKDETGNRLTKGYLSLIAEKYPHIKYINQGHNGWTSIGIAENIEKLGLVEADVYSVFLGTNDWWAGKALGSMDDYTQNTGTGTVYGAFRIIIDKLKALDSDAQIILITPMQRGDFVYINDYKNNAYGSYKAKNGETLGRFANAVIAIGQKENIAVVDLYHESGITPENAVHFKRLRNPETGEYKNYSYPEYTEIPFDPESDEYPYPPEAIDMTYDGLHPSDKGCAIIAQMLAEKWEGLEN
ncbi:SGNH/GDSL hydrolase family protein [Marinilongibacter aquaticus]|uniref:SGNH/GDSL hydrolase family protein n=1 Tax=Marinilongibacter aquaticus TaxID=2975157 RepID=UPI0021BD3553|nr:SGNH/GDSL hydrolase family protein [Marinilongibacter aquaticus]UBM60108.1 SGNH/GDSL hydrolase family protein [Marinilongibacter aquaticus]